MFNNFFSVVKARNLRKQNVYIEVIFDNSNGKQKQKTQIADDTENPTFDNEEFCL